MSEPTDDLARWAALAEAATPGPWNAGTAPHRDSGETKAEYLANTSCGDGPLWVTWAPNTTGDGFDYLVTGVTGDGPTSELNAEFVAAARTAVPRLLALVAAQAEEMAGAKATIEHLTTAMSWVSGHDRQGLDHLEEAQEAANRAERAESELATLHATDDYQRWARAVAERDAAREQVARVRALHGGWHVCANMADLGATDYSDDPEDGLQACPTIAALDGEATP